MEESSKRLKVLHIAGWYPSKKNPTAGIFVREHVKATALYNDVVVLYNEGVDRTIKNGCCRIEDNIEEGIRTIRLYYKKSPFPKTTYIVYLWSMFYGYRMLVDQGFKPDVIHAHIYSAGVPAVLIGKRYGIPVVVTEGYSGFPRKLVRGFEKFKAKLAFKLADVVCPVSEYLRKHIEHSYGIRARFKVIPNTVNTSLFTPSIRTVQKKDKKHMLVVALLSDVKGIPYLLKALSKLIIERDDFVLDIVGDGPKRREYEDLTRMLGISEVVNFHGLKSKSEVAEFMKRCDFLVVSSLFETFAVVLIEAMACGRPIVTTDCGGPSEIVTPMIGIKVPPGNSEALADAINYMLDHYSEYSANTIAKYVQECYSYQAVGSKFNSLYISLLRKETNEQRGIC